MKKAISVLLCLCLTLSVFSIVPFTAAAAETEQSSVGASSGTTGDCTWTLDDNGTLTIIGNGAMGGYDSIYSNGTWVSAAPWGANIKSVVVEDGVTSIGRNAFYGCTGLTSVTIGNSVTSIGDNAFDDCTGLTSVYITDVAAWCNIAFSNFYSNPLYYAHNLYLNNVPVTDLIIPDGVTSIGKNAFYGCTGLTSVTIPDSVTSISYRAFSGCTGLTSVTIPDSVTSIGDYAFSGCTGLTSVTIPDSVTSIGGSAFSGTGTDFTIYGNIGTAAEAYCQTGGFRFRAIYEYSVLTDDTLRLTKCNMIDRQLVIPAVIGGKSVSQLGNWMFANNTQLESVVIPNSVTSIAKGTFYNCTELKTVTMGNGVKTIGGNAFEKCLYLENINLSDQLETIGDEAFYDCRRLKQLTLPDTLTAIGEEAFTNCRSLTNLTIPDGVQQLGSSESVGYGMFENCKNLTEITIPVSVCYIQDNAFYGCTNVTIRGKRNSYAQAYAADNQLRFAAVYLASVGNANLDDKISVSDVTSIQRYLAEIEPLTDEQIALADTNKDGVVNIDDATLLQMFLAEYDVSIG